MQKRRQGTEGERRHLLQLVGALRRELTLALEREAKSEVIFLSCLVKQLRHYFYSFRSKIYFCGLPGSFASPLSVPEAVHPVTAGTAHHPCHDEMRDDRAITLCGHIAAVAAASAECSKGSCCLCAQELRLKQAPP